MFTKFRLIAAAALVVTLPIAQSAVAAPAGTQKTIKAKKIVRGGETFYCFKHEITGSRMQRRSCVTQKEIDFAGARVEVEGEQVQLVAAPREAEDGKN